MVDITLPQYIINLPYLDANWFLSASQDGKLRMVKVSNGDFPENTLWNIWVDASSSQSIMWTNSVGMYGAIIQTFGIMSGDEVSTVYESINISYFNQALNYGAFFPNAPRAIQAVSRPGLSLNLPAGDFGRPIIWYGSGGTENNSQWQIWPKPN